MPFSWDANSGKIVKRRLMAWGSVQQEKAAAGDGNLPSASGGGGRGKPGDLPGVLSASLDVDMALTSWNSGPWMKSLLLFIYRDGLELVPQKYFYILPDGGTVEMHPTQTKTARGIQIGPPSNPPVQAVDTRIKFQPRYTYRLDEFVCMDVDKLLKLMYPREGEPFETYRRKFLERAHFDFAEFLWVKTG